MSDDSRLFVFKSLVALAKDVLNSNFNLQVEVIKIVFDINSQSNLAEPRALQVKKQECKCMIAS